MGRSMTKAECLKEMERLYQQRAYSDIEIAERLGVDRTTAYRYRMELSSGDNPLLIEPVEQGKWKINRASYLSNVRVNLYESLSLYLAARRATQQSHLAGKYAASALEKISVALRQPMTERLVRAADRVLATKTGPARVRVFETVARSWAEQIPVRIHYRALQAEQLREHLIHPYLIEPSAWSDSVYAIAFSERTKTIIPFKIERIEQASLSTGRFEIPADFDEDELLKHAWGIWRRDGEPQTVRLKFAPGPAARRLQESTWHPLETVTVHDDGGCTWEAPIADWREMLPFVRGWGADCEVLAPEKLRKDLRLETKKLMRLYLNEGREMPPYLALWAKAQKNSEEYHPLLYHLIDVGMCAQALWNDGLSPCLKKFLVDAFGQNLLEDEIGRLFTFLAATHDLGKASPSFQVKNEPSIARLKEAGFEFPKRHGQNPTYHSTISTWILQDLLKDETGMDLKTAQDCAHAIGGHHGIWPTFIDLDQISFFDKGDEKWTKVRYASFQDLKHVFQPPENISLPKNSEQRNMVLTMLSGLTTAADWLGSDEGFFDYEDRVLSAEDYAKISARNAQKALATTGWRDNWQPTGEKRTFRQAFEYLNFESPRPIQRAVIDEAKNIEHPALLILEAPTGLGKTETALYLADTWLQAGKGRGMYIAMPTQATSNQMFSRTLDFLQHLYPDEHLNIHLVHGQAQWNDEMKLLMSIGDGPEDFENKMRAEAWFLPRKKTLLAPFGVGTVDQVLMSILQARHFFLRLFGLANKVVIFDEVHAYDTYMEKLFLRLLGWLRVLGTSVIVLSATLPEKTRREMVNAFNGTMPDEREQAAYPRLTLATSGESRSIALKPPEDRKIQLHWIDQSSETILQEIRERLKEGGCAAVICNTVRRAQDVYQALLAENLVPDDDLILFHSRFPPTWRKEIEEKALDKFGKDGERPSRAIIVATQVIEQSLDLDFDLMISDLAPMDLLIQRIGRLHRHKRGERPPGLCAPQLLIIQPEGEPSAPQFGSSRYVYTPYILWRTWLALDGRDEILLPSETTKLIEVVYGEHQFEEFPQESREKLEAAYQEMREEFGLAGYKAETNLIPKPGAEKLVTRRMQDLKDDDDPTLHEQVRAATRLIPPNVGLVCLHKMADGGLNLEPDGSGETINLERRPSKEETRALLQHVVSVHRKDVVRALADKTHPKWKRVTALRYFIPLVFDNGSVSTEGISLVLKLDKKLGLQIEKETL